MFKLIATGFAALFILAGAYSVSKAECAIAPADVIAQAIAELQTEHGAALKVTEFTKGEAEGLIEKLGRPPNAAEDSELKFIRIDFNANSTVVVIEGECFINKIGPIPTDLLDIKLGLKSAKGEKID